MLSKLLSRRAPSHPHTVKMCQEPTFASPTYISGGNADEADNASIGWIHKP